MLADRSTYTPVLTEISGLKDIADAMWVRQFGEIEEFLFGKFVRDNYIHDPSEYMQKKYEEGVRKTVPGIAAFVSAAVGVAVFKHLFLPDA